MSIPIPNQYHYEGVRPVLFDIDLKEMSCGKKVVITTKQPAKMSVYLPTVQKSTDDESYACYFQDYGEFYYCTLCYNIQPGLGGRPNMISGLEERSKPEPLKNGGSITNFKRHLQMCHPMFLTQKDLESLIAKDPGQLTKSVKKEISKTTNTLETYGFTKQTNSDSNNDKKRKNNVKVDDKILTVCCEFIAHGNLPLNIIESKYFKEFVNKLTKDDTKLPCRKTATKFIGKLYDRECVQFESNFKKKERYALSITTDLSTGTNEHSYGVITAHYLDRKDLVLHEELIVIAPFTAAVHNAEEVRDFVVRNIYDVCAPKSGYDDETMLHYLPRLVIAVTADCASNNNKFEKLGTVARIRCFGHRLNTLGDTLNYHKKTEFSKFTECVSQINAMLHSKHGQKHIREALFAYQRDHTTSRQMGPISGPATRWTYGPKYLRRSLKLLPHLIQVSKSLGDGVVHTRAVIEINNNFKRCVLEFEQKASILQYFMVLFTRIEFWITVTESSKYPTISMVIYAINDLEHLIKYLIQSMTDSKQDLHNEFLNFEVDDYLDTPINILQTFQTEFTNVFVNDRRSGSSSEGLNNAFFRGSDYLIIAKFLDIRFMWFNDEGKIGMNIDDMAAVTKNHFIDRFGERSMGNEVISAIDDSVPSAMTGNIGASQIMTFDEMFDKEVRKYGQATENLITKEITTGNDGSKARVYKENSEIMNMDPLKFWRENKDKYPHLFRIAVEVLATPAQSAPSERVFSKMTKIVSPGRKSLGGKLGAKLIQLSVRYNSKVLRPECRNESKLNYEIFQGTNMKIKFPPFGTSTDTLELDYFHLEDLVDNIDDEEWNPDVDGDDDEDDDDAELFTSVDAAEVLNECVDLSTDFDDANDAVPSSVVTPGVVTSSSGRVITANGRYNS